VPASESRSRGERGWSALASRPNGREPHPEEKIEARIGGSLRSARSRARLCRTRQVSKRESVEGFLSARAGTQQSEYAGAWPHGSHGACPSSSLGEGAWANDRRNAARGRAVRLALPQVRRLTVEGVPGVPPRFGGRIFNSGLPTGFTHEETCWCRNKVGRARKIEASWVRVWLECLGPDDVLVQVVRSCRAGSDGSRSAGSRTYRT